MTLINREFDTMVDTSATHNFIRNSTKAKLGLSVGMHPNLVGAGGTSHRDYSVRGSLEW